MNSLQGQTAGLWMGMAMQDLCGPGTLSASMDSGDRSLAFALACLGSGGTVLLLVRDKVAARRATQSGAVDFAVDTLGEALRILKNEIRQKRPIGVALVGPVDVALAAMIERGVQPQYVDLGGDGPEQWAVLLQRGAVGVQREQLLHDAVRRAAQQGFKLGVQAAGSAVERRQQDALLAKLLAEAGPGWMRRAALRWLQVAPRLFAREHDRVVWIETAEGRTQ